MGVTQANWGGLVLRWETSGKNNIWLGNPLFFLCLLSNAFPDIGSVGRIEKTKNLKKNHKKCWNSRPWYPRTTLKVSIHIFGLTKLFMFLFLFFSMLLLCSFFRLKELFQVKNGVTMSLLFFLKMPKIWVSQTTVNAEKKEDGLSPN